MALQDLTPQLRTRLSRMERAVGWFVILATLLLAFGFGYYVYHTAERKGWFLIKAPYYTYTDRATGLKVGDPVQMMGFDVGQITRMTPSRPRISSTTSTSSSKSKTPTTATCGRWARGPKSPPPICWANACWK